MPYAAGALTMDLLSGVMCVSSGEEAASAPAGVSEVYSPPRIAPLNAKAGLGAGGSLDLSTHDPEGRLWDFEDPASRRRAKELVERTRPKLHCGDASAGTGTGVCANGGCNGSKRKSRKC